MALSKLLDKAGMVAKAAPLFAALALVIGACGSEEPSEEPVEESPAETITGTFNLVADSDGLSIQDPAFYQSMKCKGRGGYSDLSEGAQITIRDQVGTTIAIDRVSGGRLAQGRVTVEWWLEDRIGRTEEELEFDAGDIPWPDIEAIRESLSPDQPFHRATHINEDWIHRGSLRCEWDIFVSDVPTEDVTFYSIEVASRGEVRYSKDDMEQQGWRVELGVGN